MGNNTSAIQSQVTTVKTDISNLKTQMTNVARKQDLIDYLKTQDLSSQLLAKGLQDELTKVITEKQLAARLADYLKKGELTFTDTQIASLALQLSKQTTFFSQLAQALGTQTTTLATTLANTLKGDPTFNSYFFTKIKTDPDFITALAEKVTTDDIMKARITGPPGSIGSLKDVESTMKPATVWCANGICEDPPLATAMNFKSDLNLNRAKVLRFAKEVPGESVGGTISYKKEIPQLEIIGGGKDNTDRKVVLADNAVVTKNLYVKNDLQLSDGRLTFKPGSDSSLRLVDEKGSHGDREIAASNFWVGNEVRGPNGGPNFVNGLRLTNNWRLGSYDDTGLCLFRQNDPVAYNNGPVLCLFSDDKHNDRLVLRRWANNPDHYWYWNKDGNRN